MPNQRILFFDTETTGFPSKKLPQNHPDQPDVIQLGMILADRDHTYAENSLIIKPEWMFSIHPKAEEIHGISLNMVNLTGVPTNLVLDLFNTFVNLADKLVCHNYGFDIQLMCIALAKAGRPTRALIDKPFFCTMEKGTPICNLPGRYNKPKWPKLQELHKHYFGVEFEGAHDALEDVRATRRCYYKMIGG